MHLPIRHAILLRVLAHLDQKIAELEPRLLQPLSYDDLHQAVGQLAELHERRHTIEAHLKTVNTDGR